MNARTIFPRSVTSGDEPLVTCWSRLSLRRSQSNSPNPRAGAENTTKENSAHAQE